MHRIFLLLASLFLLECAAPDSGPSQGYTLPEATAPDRIWNVAFLVMDGVYNSELVAPMDILHHSVFHTDPGMEVFTVARSLEPIRTFEGLRLLPDYSYMTDSLPRIDVLVVPSAEHHLDTDMEDEEMIAFVREYGASAQYVMSLCDGAFVLATAGLLDGRACTTFPGDIGKLRERFPNLDVRQDISFVHDGPAITSAGGAKSYDPALYLTELLYGKKVADGVAAGLVINWQLGEVKCVIVE